MPYIPTYLTSMQLECVFFVDSFCTCTIYINVCIIYSIQEVKKCDPNTCVFLVPNTWSQSIYALVTISLANHYHNTRNILVKACQSFSRKIVCVILKENSLNYNCSLVGITHTQSLPEKLWQAFTRIPLVAVC